MSTPTSSTPTSGTARLHVERAGALTTLQDAGRPGLMRFGFPASGPMDRFAHAAANVAIGRPPGSTAIEVSLGGIVLRCADAPLTVAVCGGGFAVTCAGERLTPWTVCTLAPGDTLAVAAGPWGSWCYVAVAGDVVAHRWMGSTATHVRSGLGGGVLRAGDVLVVEHARADDARDGAIEEPADVGPVGASDPMRVVLGPQLDRFAPDAAATLLGAPYVLTAAYDRMGVRLDGRRLALTDALAIPSAPIVRGSLQVDGDGLPTLLLADHQTTGGYPVIATLVADDVDRVVQSRAGDEVRFVAVEPADAVREARRRAARRAQQLDAVAHRPGAHSRRLLATNLIDGVFHDD